MSRNYSSSARKPRRPSSFGGRKSNGRTGGNRNRSRKHGQYIDPKKFVKAAKHTELTPYTPEHRFIDFEINDLLKKNLEAKGYIAPSQVQDKAIPIALKGGDVVGIANTGTGKTAAFMLPLLNKLMANKGTKSIIIAPTRELAVQIQEESRSFARGARLFDVLLIGGAPINRQLRDLQKNPEIIIGTPGRIKDHIERGSLKLDQVQTVVLDEVDRMLDMGFVNDIRDILKTVPDTKQSLYFSATLSPTIENLIRTFTKDPTTVMARTAETSDNVEQSILHYFEDSEKIGKLHDILLVDNVTKTLIFCETKRSTEKLSTELTSRGFKSDAMHGNKSQGQRQRALRQFKEGQVNILVATDVAARGIDVDGITHVINFDVPQTYDDYTHRIGRTGRGDQTGTAITFVTH
ncbi:MAG: ATP-dependent RNA helicase RhlE [Candidatus Saccharimonadales bacterium]|jgi:ATP-dependent RNA helicase RhlE